MKKRLALLAAATIGVGGLAYTANDVSAGPNPTGVPTLQPREDHNVGQPAQPGDATERPGQPAQPGATGNLQTPATQPGAGAQVQLPQGITPKDLREENDIRNSVADATEQWLQKDGLDDLVGHFVDADRNRLSDFANKHAGELNGAIDTFKQAWKEKYGKEFDFADGSNLFNQPQYVVLQGEITNPAMLSNWPVQASPNTTTPKTPAGEKPAPGMQAGNEPGDRNLDKGRNVAVFAFPSQNNLPHVNVSMIHEAIDSWKIDVPDNLTGEQLLQNLKNHLFVLGQHKDQWPQDVNEGYRLLSHHLAMAIYNVPMQQQGGMKGGMDGGMKGGMQHDQTTPGGGDNR